MSAQLTMENSSRTARTDLATGPALRRSSRTPVLRDSVGTLAPRLAFQA
jgi:hypothetical protein